MSSSSSISLLQLPRLCVWTEGEGEGECRVISGVGPHLEVYSRLPDGEYRLASRTNVFGGCGRPVMGIKRIEGSDSLLVTGSSLLCVIREAELAIPSIPSSRIHSFADEIVNIAYAERKEHHSEFGLVLRSGRTLRVRASIDTAANRLRVDTVAEYDGAKCGLLMSALCLFPAGSKERWKQMRCIAGSAMGEVRLWGTRAGVESSRTKECGGIGFVISMAVVDRCDDRSEATVVAVTENRAINLWRIRYRESAWLELLQKEEAAHCVRPSAVAYCGLKKMAVSSAEDGELCVWSIGESGFSLLRRFQTRVGAVRSLAVDAEGRIVYGSVTGSLFSLPLDSLIEQPERRFIEGSKLREEFRDCDRTPIRSFAVVHHHEKYDEGIAPGTRRTELQCLGEDGSSIEITGDAPAEWVDNEGSFLHLTSWSDRDSAITVFHDETHLRMSSYHPPDHLPADSSGYTVLSDRAYRSTILTARPTMSRGERGSEAYVAVQSTGGEIALIRHCLGTVRVWRYRVGKEEGGEGGEEGKKRRRSQMLIVNTVAIDRSSDTGLHVILGTTNGRVLYAPLRGQGEQAPEGESTLDFALDKEKASEKLNLYPRSRRLEKTSITQLEYCRERRECTALSKNGRMMRMRVVGEGGLLVSEEDLSRELGVEWPMRLERRGGEEYAIGFNGDLSRELGVEWPVRLERRGGEEYAIGFNERNLVVVSRRLKTCLLSIDCGGGHRQVHVDLEGGYGIETKEEYGSDKYGSRKGEVEQITVYYGKSQGIVRHSQRSLTAGMRQLAWTPHRDKIVFCIVADQYLLTGSIDGEIVLGTRDYDSLSVLQRWYVPETTAACVARGGEDTSVLRVVIGGPKGDLYVVEWSEEARNQPLTAISTGNDSRIIDVCALGNCIVAAFADAQIAIFRLDSSLRWRRVAAWEMTVAHRSTYTGISAHLSPTPVSDSTLLIDAITSAGTLTRLEFDADKGKIAPILDISIDRAALTVIRRNEEGEGGITVIGSDSGAIFVYRDSGHSLELQEVWRDAHACQITDLALFRSPTGAFLVVSVGMDCTVTVLEMGEEGKLSLLHRRVFAVNDPASVVVMSESDGRQRAMVAGCGLEIVELE